MTYRYETHLHTLPVSRCAHASVRENLLHYKSLGYQGVFITNHFLDGNIDISPSLPYEERIEFYFSDCEAGERIGEEIGLDVFPGVEISYAGTDFLIYGLNKCWFLSHPEIMMMRKSDELSLMMDEGALIIQAHPYREAHYIDHIRLFPRHVHGVEVYNASNSDFSNEMARHYADAYSLIHFAGSDNHHAAQRGTYGGMESERRVTSVYDFIKMVKSGEMRPFRLEL